MSEPPKWGCCHSTRLVAPPSGNADQVHRQKAVTPLIALPLRGDCERLRNSEGDVVQSLDSISCRGHALHSPPIQLMADRAQVSRTVASLSICSRNCDPDVGVAQGYMRLVTSRLSVAPSPVGPAFQRHEATQLTKE